MNIVLIDNDDSFTRNLEHLVAVSLGTAPEVLPYAALQTVDPGAWDWIILSPGPGHPDAYPGYGAILTSGVPVLGVCLGMQLIGTQFGGEVTPLSGCVHGKTDTVRLEGRDLTVARYHSLWLSRVGEDLDVLAANGAGTPMVIRHRFLPLLGYQFHPESFLTEDGGFFIRHATRILGLS